MKLFTPVELHNKNSEKSLKKIPSFLGDKGAFVVMMDQPLRDSVDHDIMTQNSN